MSTTLTLGLDYILTPLRPGRAGSSKWCLVAVTSATCAHCVDRVPSIRDLRKIDSRSHNLTLLRLVRTC